MLKIMLLLFLLPVLELFLIIKVGGMVGALPTLFLIAFSALLGAMLLRWQGIANLERMEFVLAHGGLPTGGLLHSGMLLIGGILMILPGFITDFIGILFMIPLLRRLVLPRVLAVIL